MNDQYAALAESAGGFIHEIKNHISTLGLNLQLLAEDFEDPQSQRERRALQRVQRLQAECHRLVEVANDFLRFARIKELKLAPTDLAKLLEEMIDFFGPTARAANIDIKTYLPADLPPIPLDRELFKQALLNLFLNAEQAMPAGGAITIQAALELPSLARRGKGAGGEGADQSPLVGAEGPRASPLAPGGRGVGGGGTSEAHVSLSIIDTGKGIAPELLAKIFEPFFSTKQGGSGLGLATTRKIVEAHHGTIEVQSDLDKGTKFTIRLPALSCLPTHL